MQIVTNKNLPLASEQIQTSCHALLFELRSTRTILLQNIYVTATLFSKRSESYQFIERINIEDLLEINSLNQNGGYIKENTNLRGCYTLSPNGNFILEDGDYIQLDVTADTPQGSPGDPLPVTISINTIKVWEESSALTVLKNVMLNSVNRDINIENVETLHFKTVPERVLMDSIDRTVEMFKEEIIEMSSVSNDVVFTNQARTTAKFAKGNLTTLSVPHLRKIGIFPTIVNNVPQNIFYIEEKTRIMF